MTSVGAHPYPAQDLIRLGALKFATLSVVLG